MSRKDGRHIKNDTPEQIAMCLSCQRERCVNCIDRDPDDARKQRERYARRRATGWKKKLPKRKTMTVDGKIITEKIIAMLQYYPAMTTDKQIGDLCGLASCSVCDARKRFGLPPATAPAEEKEKLARHYLDKIQRQKNLEAV